MRSMLNQSGRWRIHVRLTLISGAIFLTSCFLLPKEEPILTPPLVEPPPITYRTVTVERGTIERRIIVGGTIVYSTQTALKFDQRSGHLKEILVRIGDDVVRGQILASLDTDGLRFDLERQHIRLQKAELALSRTQVIGQDKFQIELDRLDVRLEQLLLQKIETELSKSTIFSPFTGKVVYVTSILPGDPINERETVIQIADPFDLLFAYQGQHDDEFFIGTEVKINLRGEVYDGVVVRTPRNAPPDITKQDRKIVLIRVDAPIDTLSSGWSGTATMITDRRDDVIVLPTNAMKAYLNRTYVFVLEDGLPVERNVATGLTTATRVEITDGLKPGEIVVLR